MNFIEALRLAMQGKRIRNKQWSVSTYIFETHGDILYEGGGKYSFFLPHMLNNDWEVYEEPKTYTFQEAFDALGNGKMISRVKKSGLAVHMNRAKSPDELILFSYEDIKANDWRIIEDKWDK